MESEELLLEAFTVGITLVPVWALVTQFTVPFVSSSMKQTTDIALTGIAYHLLCEQLGINEWYLSNGFASRKLIQDYTKKWSTPSELLLYSGPVTPY